MSAVANVVVNVDARDASRSLRQVQAQSQQAGRALDGTGKAAATATANIQRFGIAFRSVLGPLVGVVGAVNLLSRSLNVLGERQADAAALANGLEKVGASTVELKRLQQIADELGKQTLFNQEDFDRGFALLTSFQSIGVGSYERVAKAAADVAQVTGQDVNSSLLQLAKALQDPVKGLTALARSGTQFTEAQQDQIKALVEAGRALEAQDFILKEIEKQYGNAAAAAGSAGYAGAVDSLQESFRDFQEQLAKGVQPAITNVLGLLGQFFDLASKIPQPVGQAALQLGLTTAAFIALRNAMQSVIAVRIIDFITQQIALYRTFGAAIYGAAAAQGALTAATNLLKVALGALPFAIVAFAVQKYYQEVESAKQRTQSFETALKSQNKELLQTALNAEIAAQALARQKIAGQQLSPRGERGGGFGLIAAQKELALAEQRISKLKQAISGVGSIAPGVTAPEIPGGTGKPDKEAEKAAREAEKLAREIERSLAAGKQLGIEFSRQVQLLDEGSELERKRLQIQFEYEDRAAEIAELKNAEQRTNLTILNDEIRRLEIINLQTEALKKQAEEAQKLFKEALDKAEFGVDGDGTVAGNLSKEISKLEEELKPVNVATNLIVNGATAIGDAFSTAFGEVITGSKSVQEALSGAFKKIGEAFVSMALEIIAKQMTLIILQTIFNALSGASTRATAGKNLTGTGALAQPAAVPGLKVGGYAEGGFVTGPTNALIGEGGEPEYVIPASKMRTAMGRYSAGARGSSVVSGTGKNGSENGVSTATMEPIDVRYSVERINNVDYVTAEQFQRGMAEAAQQGASQGETRALRKLQMSSSTRRRVGI